MLSMRQLRVPARRIATSANRAAKLNRYPLLTASLQSRLKLGQRSNLPATCIRTYTNGRPQPPGGTHRMDMSGGEEKSALEQYGVDLTARAKTGKLDPVIGRDSEIHRTIQVLSRRTKNNPVLIGSAGTGKTAILEVTFPIAVVSFEGPARALYGILHAHLCLAFLRSAPKPPHTVQITSTLIR